MRTSKITPTNLYVGPLEIYTNGGPLRLYLDSDFRSSDPTILSLPTCTLIDPLYRTNFDKFKKTKNLWFDRYTCRGNRPRVSNISLVLSGLFLIK